MQLRRLGMVVSSMLLHTWAPRQSGPRVRDRIGNHSWSGSVQERGIKARADILLTCSAWFVS